MSILLIAAGIFILVFGIAGILNLLFTIFYALFLGLLRFFKTCVLINDYKIDMEEKYDDFINETHLMDLLDYFVFKPCSEHYLGNAKGAFYEIISYSSLMPNWNPQNKVEKFIACLWSAICFSRGYTLGFRGSLFDISRKEIEYKNKTKEYILNDSEKFVKMITKYNELFLKTCNNIDTYVFNY